MSAEKSKNKWTDDQQAAIDHVGRGIIVSAAAGSGKTSVLIERIITMLCDKSKNIPADTLLAVTFTNDAAAQMRDKLNAAFEKKLAENPSDEWILKQQNLVQLARISTIDSFCLDLVKENLHKFEYQGGLKILEDAESEMIFYDSCTQALEDMCRDRPEDYALLDDCLNASGSEFYKLMNKLYKFLRTICFRDKWIESAKANCSSPEMFERAAENLFANAEKKLGTARSYFEKLEFYFNYQYELAEEKYSARECVPCLEKLYGVCQDALSGAELAVKHREWSKAGGVTVEWSDKITARKEGIPEDLADTVKEWRADIKKIFDKLKDNIEDAVSPFRLSKEHYRAVMEKSNTLFDLLCGLTENIESIAYEAKLEKNAVDFSDVEMMAKNLLVRETESGCERTELAEEIRSSGMYKIIMIDEFQDVNNLQEIIFKAVSDSETLEIMGKNTFLVGDVKQAIYGFRLTNPALFKKCLAQSVEDKNSDKLEAIYLKKNFRSSREVIDFSNFMFRNLMSTECGGVEYNGNERLEYGAEWYTKKRDYSTPTEIMLVRQSEDFNRSLGYTEEMSAVAHRIRELIDGGQQTLEDGIQRLCKPSDFCILVNTNDEIKGVSKALETVGLRSFAEDTKGYMKSREISVAVNILRVIDNPMNDIALTAVMMSPVMGFTPDEMARIREKCRIENSRQLKHIYQILSGTAKDKSDSGEHGAYTDMGDVFLQGKCIGAFELIEGLRYSAMSMSLERLIHRIFEVTDLIGMTALYLDADKKRANLRLLQEYAGAYEQNGKDGITGFLRYIDSVSDNDEAFKNAVSVASGVDSVNVKTYHKSKGLEYPFVFLCSLGSDMVKERNGAISLKLHNDFGYGLNFYEKKINVKRRNIYSDHMSVLCKGEDKGERMRLFYVGCTRAKEKLFLVCAHRHNGREKLENKQAEMREMLRSAVGCEKPDPQLVLEQDTVLKWAVLALSRLKGREALEEWLGDTDLFAMPYDTEAEGIQVDFRLCDVPENAENISDEQTQEQSDVNTDDIRYVNQKALELRKKYSFTYNNDDALMPAKLSVTEIVEAEHEKTEKGEKIEFFPNLPRLSDELDKLTAAEKGTFTHKFMQLADYNNARTDVKAELDRLTRNGFFSEKEAGGVYVEKLRRFFASDFFERMQKSTDIRREQQFLASVKDLKLPKKLGSITGQDGMIQGIADCIFKEDDGWVLVDYKTDNFKSEEDMEKYGTQLAIYKAAFELIYGEPVKSSYIYSFKLEKGREFML